jgi:2-dehydropantoate 2-reductase
LAEFPQWHILGAGSIGGLWAARLQQAGRTPTLILQEDAYADYQQQGGLIIDDEGLAAVTATTAKRLNSAIKYLVVCCKAHQTIDALSTLVTRLHKECVIVLVQNGMGTDEKVRRLFPHNRILCGTTTNGAYRTQRFHIVPAGVGETHIGSLDHIDASTQALITSLSCPDFEVQHTQAILPLLWRKLAISCVVNPLTVRYQCLNGGLLEIPRARADVAAMCEEMLSVSRALGRESGIEDLEKIVLCVVQQTANNRSSMLQDNQAGRTTEIESINGYLCQLAAANNIAAPLNKALYQEISSLK